MKSFSIIIPCFNASDYIDICAEHLINQTIGMENIEIIFVDDMSTDDTFTKLSSYESQYPDSIMLISTDEKLGPGGCRNAALTYASGEYIGYCDADDWFSYDALEYLYAIASKNAADVVEFSYENVYSHDGTEKTPTDDSIVVMDVIKRDEPFIDLDMDILAWNKIYRRTLLTDNCIEFLTNATYEEPPFSQMVKLCMSRYIRSSRICYYYYKHEGSMSTKFWERRFDMINAYCKFFDDTIRQGLYGENREIVDYTFWCGCYYMPMLNMASKDLFYSKEEYISIQERIRTRVGNIASNRYFESAFRNMPILASLSYNNIEDVDMDDIKALFKQLLT